MPAPTPVTTPIELTVATAGFDDAQAIEAPPAGLPRESVMVALSRVVLPTVVATAGAESVSEVTTCDTVRLTVSEVVPQAATIAATPSDFDVTIPSVLTIAIDGAALVQ